MYCIGKLNKFLNVFNTMVKSTNAKIPLRYCYVALMLECFNTMKKGMNIKMSLLY